MSESKKELVAAAAQELDKTAAEAWSVYVQGQQIEGTLTVIMAAFVFVVPMTLSYIVYRLEISQDGPHPEDAAISAAFGSFIILAFLSILSHDALMQIIIPEYTAMQEIITAAARTAS